MDPSHRHEAPLPSSKYVLNNMENILSGWQLQNTVFETFTIFVASNLKLILIQWSTINCQNRLNSLIYIFTNKYLSLFFTCLLLTHIYLLTVTCLLINYLLKWLMMKCSVSFDYWNKRENILNTKFNNIFLFSWIYKKEVLLLNILKIFNVF